jgi:hypothetical protein
MKFRKKPCEIEAVQYLGFEENGEECELFLGDAFESHLPDWNEIYIYKSGVVVVVNKDDWIVRDTDGEYLLYKPDVFEKMYERVFEEDFDPYSPT